MPLFSLRGSQPVSSMVPVAALTSALVAGELLSRSATGLPGQVGAAMILALAIAAAYHAPIDLRNHLKVWLTSPVVFVAATHLGPAIAVAVVGTGFLAGEVSTRTKRGATTGDIARQTVRWAGLALVASVASHWLGGSVTGAVAAAGVLWVGDMVTAPVVVIPVTGQRPLAALRGVVRDGGPLEAAQYLFALAIVAVPAVALISVAGSVVVLMMTGRPARGGDGVAGRSIGAV